ncbi:MAG: efflux RND transporter periplasmic adaptor subunit [Lachnospiraceae bacterium]|nr:efflux RND transporter periplasmic adaptor subunit [Lachnospiraceae bacterium]
MFRKAKNEAENTDIKEMMPTAKKEKKPWDKAKKKKVRRRVIAGTLAVLLIAFFVGNSLMAKNAAPMVTAVAASVGDVEQILSTGGTVKSDETRTYFAPLPIEVGEVKVSTGDTVKKGDVILTFDEKALSEKKQEAEYRLASNEGGYESSVHKNNEYIADLSEANRNLPVLDQQIADNENLLDELNKKIEEKKAGWSYNGTNLNVSVMEWQQIIAQDEQILADILEKEAKGELNHLSDKEKREMRDNAEIKLANDRDTLLNLQIQTQYNGYEESYNKEIRELQKQAKDVEELIASYKEYRSEMKSQKAASESGVLDEGGKAKLEADTALEKLTNQERLDAIAKVENGLKADFAGVVTEMEAVAGQPPVENGKLATIESTEKVYVRLSVSKYDLEKISVGQKADVDIAGKTYEGTVSKIDGMATQNNSGAMVVGVDVNIDNPDENIFLGVEARVYVHMAKVEGVVTVPLEVINSDREGDFVYVEKNGVVEKRRITAGISSDSVSEVKEGLSEGDNVIMANGMEFEEGMAVTVIPMAQE